MFKCSFHSCVGLMWGQRRRQWHSIKPTLDQRVVLAGFLHHKGDTHKIRVLATPTLSTLCMISASTILALAGSMVEKALAISDNASCTARRFSDVSS